MNTTNKVVNIAYRLRQTAKDKPHKRAVVFPVGTDNEGRITYAHRTFQQLDKDSDNLAMGLESVGISRGIRTIIMVPPGIEFFTLTFALFKVGAVPVVVDPGMGIKRMLQCLSSTRAEAFIGIPKAHVLRTLKPGFFKSVNTFVTVGRRLMWGGHTYKNLMHRHKGAFKIAPTLDDETAAILFTTGSTGPAKGVVYTHGNFDAQIDHIKANFDIKDDEIDLPTFPLFALFDPALGMTAVIPDMDPTKPALVNPVKIIEAIENQGVTNMFASPALLNRVGGYGQTNEIKLKSLRRVVSAGAPVLPDNIKQFSSMLCNGAQIHTPYGATEAVPILSIGSDEILNETCVLSERGFGTCVGRAMDPVEVQLIKISDDPVEVFHKGLTVPTGEVGEITVRGPLVTRQYFENHVADNLSKVKDGDTFWHRMGDLGWKDKKGRFWFCGRKNHRVTMKEGNLYTIPCEAIFNRHPNVFRSALVGIGERKSQIPVICIELNKEAADCDKRALTLELLNIARSSDITTTIEHILYKDTFPVDIRHNSKIFRENLAVWAKDQIKKNG